MKRRLLAIGITAMMAVSMFGCGQKEAADTTDAPAPAETEEAKESEEAPKAADDAEKDETPAADLLDWEQELAKTYTVNGDETFTWGYITMSFTDTFCAKVQEEVENYTKENYPNVKLNVADGKNDVNTQMELMENFITQGVDAILLTPVDSDGDVAVCGLAQEAGIPVINITAEPNCTEEDHFFIGSDHYLSGQLQAEYLIENVDDSETLNLCYLEGSNGYTHTTLRKEGFFETLDEAGYNYELLASLEGEYLRDKAMDITEDWMVQYGDKIDVIVAANDEMAMGALQAEQAAGVTGIVNCGIDANDDAKKAVSDGTFGCTVFQNAVKQGQWGAIAAYSACASDLQPEFIEIPYELVTKDNLADYQ